MVSSTPQTNNTFYYHHTNSFFERSFLCAAPTLWNKLSIDIRMLEFDQFKSRVKTELYLKYFEA